MEKKSLGRSLEDISNIFLSTNEQTRDENMSHGFSSVAIRDDICSSCIHIVEDPSGYPRCRIFTLGSEKYGVTHLDSITLNHAKYCEYFESNILRNKDTTLRNEADYSYQAGAQYEVEETVTVKKEIAYQNIGDVQQKIRSAISKHLQEGYSIRLISLRKSDEISGPGNRERRNEEVIIYTKQPQST